MNRKPSRGKCFLCNGTYAKGGMSRHLKTCITKYAAAKEMVEKKAKTAKKKDCLHVQVRGRYLPQYWMHLEMPIATTFAELDLFLRDIWLECCGHLSAFNILGQSYSVAPDNYFSDKSMNVSLTRVVNIGEYFTYEYDFGSTTELTLRLVERTNKSFLDKKIAVLARNDEPEYHCDYCAKIAVEICSECIYDDAGWLCEECVEEHECGEDMLLPVANSPRVGVCAYAG